MATLSAVDFDPFKKFSASPEDFRARYGSAAEKAGKALGVDPSVLLGQWGLETGWGKSVVPGTNNLGNIKDFAGGGVAATDNMTGSKDKYRAYDSPEAFADDFTSLIQRKYPGAVGAKDPLAFAQALKAGGYAEDPRYVDKVVQASRMAGTQQNPVMKAVGKAVESVIPSANAAEPQLVPVDFNPFATSAAPSPESGGAAFGVYAPGRRKPENNTKNATENILMGGARGIKDVIDTGAQVLSNLGGPEEAARIKAMNEQGKADFNADYGGNALASVGRVGGNVLATLPVGPVLGAGARAAGLTRFGNALASGGATAGKVAPGYLPAAENLLLRSAGGGVTGGTSAALIDPNAATTGAGVGAAIPFVGAAGSKIGESVGAALRPFYGGGQERIVGDTLRRFATNPSAARNALSASAEMVPGSAPIAATAAGDDGLAALSRAMQNASPEYASALSARQTAQNQARTAAMEGIAGNTGKIDLAKKARDELTGPMREEVLKAAGKVPSDDILTSIDRKLANPENAGQLSQQALNQFRGRIAQFSKDGSIDARALYAIRKDINDVLGGKLQGEAGNIRYASGQLTDVKGLIDDAIDQASRRVATGPVAGRPLSASREVVPFTPSTEVGQVSGNRLAQPQSGVPGQYLGPGAEGAAATGSARPTWRGYLKTYADESIPIRQMEKLDEILKSVQTGTVDSQGGAILSAAKLNNLLKNQGNDLAKDLSAKQLDVLRRIQADLNAGQIANNTGRAVGSNTVQNLAQNQLLEGVLGSALGRSTAATSTLGRVLQLPYGAANQQIQSRLGNALLDPQEAARLLSEPQTSALKNALSRGIGSVGYRALPAISAR